MRILSIRVAGCAVIAAALAGCVGGDTYTRGEMLRDVALIEVRDFSADVKAALSGQSPSSVMAGARRVIANRLKDPGSAQFRDVRLVAYLDGAVVCGQVNAKNSFGGYVGYADFVASTREGRIRFSGDRDPDYDRLVNWGLDVACAGKPYAPQPAGIRS